MDVMEAIKGRRSIRKYKPDPVDDKTVEAVLDAARLAPSWANTQCWRFIVVRDAETKRKLAECLYPGNSATIAIEQAPVVIIACAKLGEAGFLHDHSGPATSKGDIWYMFDVATAMSQLMLAAHAMGLGTVHVGGFKIKKAEALLGIPEGFTIVEMTPLGYPVDQPKARPRKELGEIVFYEKFGNTGK
ncbi:MAG: nitroreductase family protein [Dehalococcoidales bacterium]|nr:nitroreductase family protein [Dehalococcoidales bacterium]